jgi:phosphate starvation-inducible membrane PsiE
MRQNILFNLLHTFLCNTDIVVSSDTVQLNGVMMFSNKQNIYLATAVECVRFFNFLYVLATVVCLDCI